MKNFIIILLTVQASLFTIHTVIAQSCLTNGIIITTQAQIDNFQANYPGCTEIEGDVIIEGNNISNLEGLNVITSIGGFLHIGGLATGNPILGELTGLDNLISIEEELWINNCDLLTNLSGLDNLAIIGGDLHIGHYNNYGSPGNQSLVNLSGLNSLNSIGGNLIIFKNSSLTMLTGLENLSSISGDLIIGDHSQVYLGNPQLSSLQALENLTSVGGNVIIQYNYSLTNLDGLENMTNIGGGIKISCNYNLVSLNALAALTSVEDYLYIGGTLSLATLTGLENIIFIGGDLIICHNNALHSLEGLTELEFMGGDVNIDSNAELTSLSGLGNIISIVGDLHIDSNPVLTSLSGLDIITIGGDLSIHNNAVLSSLSGLESLVSIEGSVQIGEWGGESLLIKDLTGLNGLTFIGGGLSFIDSDSLVNLNGLDNLDSIGGNLYFHENTALSNLDGINNVSSIGGSLIIDDNPVLSNLSGLDGITNIGGNLEIIENDILENLTGLESLTMIGGDLTVGVGLLWGGSSMMNRNGSLTSLEGLNSLSSIGGNLFIYGQGALTTLTALTNLTCLGGNLDIGLSTWYGPVGNTKLTSLAGLDNIESASIDSIHIAGNASLSDCNVESLCNYLASPNGSITIYGNAQGCNNPPEIAATCGITLPCLPFGHYTLITQTEIDNFQDDYLGCVDLMGNLEITGNDIDNLDGLNMLNSISGSLTLHSTGISNMSGLDHLTSIGANLFIYTNDSLQSLTGLDSLYTLSGSLSIGGMNKGNTSLNDITGISNLESQSVKRIQIEGNNHLSKCAVASICEYLVIHEGYVEIYDNATGCNSYTEVEAACLTDVPEQWSVISLQPTVICFPNPTSSATEFLISNFNFQQVSLKVYNAQGQEVATVMDKVLPPGEHTVRWDASALPAGIYYYRLTTKDQRPTTGKIVKYQR